MLPAEARGVDGSDGEVGVATWVERCACTLSFLRAGVTPPRTAGVAFARPFDAEPPPFEADLLSVGVFLLFASDHSAAVPARMARSLGKKSTAVLMPTTMTVGPATSKKSVSLVDSIMNDSGSTNTAMRVVV